MHDTVPIHLSVENLLSNEFLSLGTGSRISRVPTSTWVASNTSASTLSQGVESMDRKRCFASRHFSKGVKAYCAFDRFARSLRR